MSKVFIVAGLGYGDEGKGGIVSYLAQREKASAVVRYNGGSQAGHAVVLDDGRHHIFSQFGAGTFSGAKTFLSRYMIVNPIPMLAEAAGLEKLGVKDPLRLVSASGMALITTPFHVATNRLREIHRNKGRHGSCGMGVGETMKDSLEYPGDVLLVCHLHDRRRTRAKLHGLRERKLAEMSLLDLPDNAAVDREMGVLRDMSVIDKCVEYYDEFRYSIEATVDDDNEIAMLMKEGPVIFEGAQGVLLDENLGFFPYNTWTATTMVNADTLLNNAVCYGEMPEVSRIGVFRAYSTRHGAGPLVTEDDEMTRRLPDSYNHLDAYQGGFRVGHLDAVTIRYAMGVCKYIDTIALTHLDKIPKSDQVKICYGYQTERDESLFGYFGDAAVSIKHGDGDHQARLGTAMMNAKPLYVKTEVFSDLDLGPPGVVGVIEEVSGVGVGICSLGPRPGDKYDR